MPNIYTQAGIVPERTPPDDYIYNTQGARVAISATGTTQKLNPTIAGPFTPGQQILRFEFEALDSADLSSMAIQFNMNCSKTGGTYVRPPNGVWAIFQEMRLMQGTSVKYRESNKHLASAIGFKTFMTSKAVAAQGNYLMGEGTTTQRNTFGAQTTSYMVPIFSDVLRRRPIPIPALTTKFAIEFDLTPATQILETDGTVPGYTISNVQLRYRNVKINDSSYYSTLINSSIWWTYSHINVETIPIASGLLKIDQPLQMRLSNISKIFMVIRNQSDVSSPSVNDKLVSWKYLNTSDYQIVHDGHNHPIDPVDCTGTAIEAYFELINAVGVWNSWNGGTRADTIDLIPNSEFLTTSFIMALNLQPFENSPLTEGSDTTNNAARLRLNFSTALPNAIELDVFYVSDGLIKFQDGTFNTYE